MAVTLKKSLAEALRQVTDVPMPKLLETRYQRLMQYGKFEEQIT